MTGNTYSVSTWFIPGPLLALPIGARLDKLNSFGEILSVFYKISQVDAKLFVQMRLMKFEIKDGKCHIKLYKQILKSTIQRLCDLICL